MPNAKKQHRLDDIQYQKCRDLVLTAECAKGPSQKPWLLLELPDESSFLQVQLSIQQTLNPKPLRGFGGVRGGVQGFGGFRV